MKQWVILRSYGDPVKFDNRWDDKVKEEGNKLIITDYAGRIKGVFEMNRIDGYYVSDDE